MSQYSKKSSCFSITPSNYRNKLENLALVPIALCLFGIPALSGCQGDSGEILYTPVSQPGASGDNTPIGDVSEPDSDLDAIEAPDSPETASPSQTVGPSATATSLPSTPVPGHETWTQTPTPTPTPVSSPSPEQTFQPGAGEDVGNVDGESQSLSESTTHLDGQFSFQKFGSSLESISHNGSYFLAVGAPGESQTHASFGEVHLFSSLNSDTWSTSPQVTFVGHHEEDGAGASLIAGDFNDDGAPDLLVGAPSSAKVYAVQDVLSVPQGSIRSLGEMASLNSEPGSLFGFVLSAGDLNGDGIDDAIIGAPQGSTANAGQVQVIFGRSDFPVGQTAPDLRIDGSQNEEMAGFALSAGDFSGGGFQSLAIGSPGTPGVDSNNAGSVSVFIAKTTWDPHTTTAQADAIFLGESPGGLGGSAGAAIVLGCDLDGDGIGDLAIGAPDYGGTDSQDMGRIYIIKGASGLRGSLSLSVADVRITGEEPGDHLGSSLTCTPDLNGDGSDELLASAPGAKSGLGEVYILWGGARLFSPAGTPSEKSTVIQGDSAYTDLGRGLVYIPGVGLGIGAPLFEPDPNKPRLGRVWIAPHQ